MRAYPIDINLDNALVAFNRADNSKNIIRIEIFQPLFQHTWKPFLPGDMVVADKVLSISSKLSTRFYLISKADNKALFFANITEKNDHYSVLPEHENESILIKKDQLFEAVDVYEVLYYERSM